MNLLEEVKFLGMGVIRLSIKVCLLNQGEGSYLLMVS